MVVQELLTRLGFTVDPSGIKKGQDALSGFKSFIGKLALGAGVAMIGKMAIQSAAQMESLTAQFKTMLGSEEKAAEFMKNINKFAAETPFETADIAGAAQTLMGFGVKSEDVMRIVSMLGDVAGANGQKFQSLALVFGQIQSTGRLMGQDLLQLINAGFNPLKVISDETGVSMKELKERMEKGQISARAVELAFQKATSQGGMFYQNLKNQSQTFQGVWSTMMDNIRMSMTKAVLPFMPMIKRILTAIGKIDFSPLVAQFEQIAGKASDITPLIISLGNGMVTLLTYVVSLFQFIQENWGLVKAFLVAWATLWGAAKLQGMYAALMALKALGGSMSWFTGLTWGAVAANAKLYLSNIQVAWSLGGIKWAAAEAGLALKAMATAPVSPLMALAALLAAIYYFYTKVNEEEEKRVKEENDLAWTKEQQRFQGMIADKKLALAEDKKLLESMDQQGWAEKDKAVVRARIKAAEAELPRLQKAFGEFSKDVEAQHKAGPGSQGALGGVLQEQMKSAEGTLQRTVEQTNKNMNIKNELNMEINAAGGKDGKTGLTASQIAELANTAVKAQFNIQLKKALVGA